jgi:hypothetical protein
MMDIDDVFPDEPDRDSWLEATSRDLLALAVIWLADLYWWLCRCA